MNYTSFTYNGNAAQIEFPTTTLAHDFRVYHNPNLTTVSLPALQRVDDRAGKSTGLLQFNANQGLVHLSAPVLTHAYSVDLTNNSALPVVDFPALASGSVRVGSIFSSPNRKISRRFRCRACRM